MGIRAKYAFREAFGAELKKFGIFHHTTSPYMPSSNKLADRAVQSIKAYFYKLGTLQQNKLQDLLYRLNNTPSVIPGAGYSFTRFIGRKSVPHNGSLLRR